MAEHNEIGKIGENITETFLKMNDFKIIERNYRTKSGEIDIIAEKDSVLRFIEVKSVKVRDFAGSGMLNIQPEDNLTWSKWKKLVKTIDIYLAHKEISYTKKYQVDLACVYINTETRQGRVTLLENIHKEE